MQFIITTLQNLSAYSEKYLQYQGAINMKPKNPRMARMRESRIASGLVPLRITEVWCTEEQKKELQIKIAAVIASVIPS